MKNKIGKKQFDKFKKELKKNSKPKWFKTFKKKCLQFFKKHISKIQKFSKKYPKLNIVVKLGVGILSYFTSAFNTFIDKASLKKPKNYDTGPSP